MAVRKKTAEETVTIAKNVKPGEKLVTLRIPLVKGQQNYTDVYINDRSWRIKHGESVQVPECVAKVLRNAEDMVAENIAFISENAPKEG